MKLRMNEFKKSKKVMFVTCTEFKQPVPLSKILMNINLKEK
jgi:hypothetical protein